MSGTGEGKRQLVQGIRSDLCRIRRECESLAHECEKVHEEAKGLNGWPAVWKGVSQLLAQAAVQLREAERSELPKMNGRSTSRIISDVNQAQFDAVKAARTLEDVPEAPATNGTSPGSGGASRRNGDRANGNGAGNGTSRNGRGATEWNGSAPLHPGGSGRNGARPVPAMLTASCRPPGGP